MPEYTKPHLTYAEQIEHLSNLGLDCEPAAVADHALRDIGYYRLTAYTYPFRRLLGPDEQRETRFQYRAQDYVAGSRLLDAVNICMFDHGLRNKIFEGIAKLELALRVQIAYVLGWRDTFGQTNRASLDARASSAPPPNRHRSKYADMFDYWLDEYDKLISRSNEDFISHVQEKYEGEIPVWIAVETFDFGGLTRLYGLLEKSDQNEIARRFGVTSGSIFHRWLVGIGVIRNHCAHHNRLWNRQLPSALAQIAPATVDASIVHLNAVGQRNKLYVWVGVLAYCLRSFDPTSGWHRTFTTQMKKFPGVAGIGPAQDMGFPEDWMTQPLWASSPDTSRPLTD